MSFLLTAGQESDYASFEPLYGQALEAVRPRAVVLDKGYDSNAVRLAIAQSQAKAVIPSRCCRKVPIPHDARLYRQRNRVERLFNKLKHFRRIATRYDKLAATFHSALCLVLAFLFVKINR